MDGKTEWKRARQKDTYRKGEKVCEVEKGKKTEWKRGREIEREAETTRQRVKESDVDIGNKREDEVD